MGVPGSGSQGFEVPSPGVLVPLLHHAWINQIFVKLNSGNYIKICAVEVYTTKFSQSLFFTENLGKRYVYWKKSIVMNPENNRVNNFCFKFFYLGFILFLHFSI